MNGFVRIEPHQADLVMRIPLDLLRAVSFPIVGGHYDPAASQTGNQGGARLPLQRSHAVGGRAAPAAFARRRAAGATVGPVVRGIRPGGRRIASPPAPDTQIAFELGYLDVHFTYPITSPRSVFAIESVVGADLGDTVKLTLRFTPLDGSSRAMVISGGSGRVRLDPTWYEASLSFIKLGVEHILTGD